jgi:transposase
MKREVLIAYRDRGLSLEEIASIENRHPSTIGYWFKKHGLAPNGHDLHASRGGIARDTLERMIDRGLSQREMAAELDRSPSTIRYWLGRHGLRTERRHRIRPEDQLPRVERHCPIHGRVLFYRRSDTGYRCTKCNQAAVAERRRQVKRILVREAGGQCIICGYDRCLRNLHFHHRDPAEKSFALSGRGFSRSLAALREEARKCELLCGNCHYEVEEGVTELPR